MQRKYTVVFPAVTLVCVLLALAIVGVMRWGPSSRRTEESAKKLEACEAVCIGRGFATGGMLSDQEDSACYCCPAEPDTGNSYVVGPCLASAAAQVAIAEKTP